VRERRTEDAEENQEDGRRRQTHEKGGETHIVAVVCPQGRKKKPWEVTWKTNKLPPAAPTPRKKSKCVQHGSKEP